MQFSRFFYAKHFVLNNIIVVVEIIVENVLIDNFVINYLILFLSAKLLSSKIVWWRFLLSIIFGTSMAFLFPILILPTYLTVALKILVGVLMIIIAFKLKGVKSFFLHFLVFVSATALFGGLAFAFSYLCFGSLEAMTFGKQNIPVGLFFAIIAVYVYVIFGVIKYILKKQKIKKFIYAMKIFEKDNCYKLEAYLDSAHNLVDPESASSIVIINFSTFNKIFKIPLEKVLLKQTKDYLKNAHYIDYQTINKKNEQMLVFSVDKIELEVADKKLEKSNVLMGLSMVDFGKNFNCDALISPMFF